MARIWVALGAVVIIASACSSSDPGEFSLARYELTATSNEYTIESKLEGDVELGGLSDLVPEDVSDAAAGGSLPLQIDVSGRLRISTAPDGENFKVTVEILELKGEVESPAGMQEVDEVDLGIDTKTETVITPEGKPADPNASADLGGLGGLGGNILEASFCGPQLSGDGLEPGQSWTSEEVVALGADVTAEHTYEEEKVLGRDAAVIETTVASDLDTRVDLSELGALLGGFSGGFGGLAGINLGMSGRVDAKSTCTLEIPNQTMLAASSESMIDVTLEPADRDEGSQFAELFSGLKTDMKITSDLEIVGQP